jgi:hypothetical protein
MQVWTAPFQHLLGRLVATRGEAVPQARLRGTRFAAPHAQQASASLDIARVALVYAVVCFALRSCLLRALDLLLTSLCPPSCRVRACRTGAG